MSIPMINRSEPLPGYKLLERLGSGGFGEVWKCEAPGGILKAIKFVYGDMEATGEEGALAEREHKALERIKQVRHPFILSLERYDIIDGRLVILTELADCNLWDRFREYRNQGMNGIPREELLRYLHEAAEALDMMNDEHQLQHLDVKPQNLFLVHKHIKVADFGMAKVFEGMRATITGGVTPVYAAPETFEGWISRHCDQYSLAIVYQELLTGVRPFNGANTKQLLLQHLSSPPNVSPLPESDRPIVSRSLAKKADDRYPSCLALIEALQQAQQTAPAPRPAFAPATPTSPADSPPPSPIINGVPPPRPRPSATVLVGEASGPSGTSTQQLATTLTERNGAGALQPTLVVGVGWLGGRVVRRLAAAIRERFGELARIPCVRLLAIDTDAEAIQALTTDRTAPLDAKSTMWLRMERATQYSRRDVGASLDKWIPNGMLFRMPRIPATRGVRAFGRLALLDHSRAVAQRLHAELAAASAPAALADADRATGLGLRCNRPRVFLVSGLSGGAGGGMMPDLAYLIREALRKLRFDKQDVAGILLVPGAGAKPQALANGCAALTEIAQWSRPDVKYTLAANSREPFVVDSAAPFNRIVAIPLESGGEARTGHAAVGQAAGLLLGEIAAPLGRAVDNARIAATQLIAPGPVCQVASTYRFVWPRRRLIRRAAVDLTERLLRVWTMKDASFVRQAVSDWLDEQWVVRKFQPELLIERLQESCAAAMGQSPDAKFDALVGPLANRAALGSRVDAYSACAVLDDVFELVGKPLQKGQVEPTPGLLQRTLGELAASIAAEYDKKLAELAVHFIEQPGPRLAAAEEAIRQLIERLQVLVQTYENLYLTLEREVIDVFKKLFPIVGQIDTGALGTRKSTLVTEVLDLLRAYPKKRYQAMIASFALSTYRGLLGAAPEFLREVNYCRERLAEVALMAEQSAANEADAAGGALGPGCDLFPGGQSNLKDAARALASGFADDDLRILDEGVQQQIRKQFHSLVGYCLELGGSPGPLLELIEDQANQCVGQRLDASSAADVFFEHYGDEQAAHRAITAAVSEAIPEMAARRAADGVLLALAVPEGPAGDRLMSMAEQAADDRRFVRASSIDDLVVYCERGYVPLAELPPLSPAGREAYQKALAADVPPHARCDIKWSLPGK